MTTASVSGMGLGRQGDAHVFATFGLAVGGVAAAAVTVWAVARSPILVGASGDAAWRGVYVGSLVAVGAYVFWRRPGNRIGLMIAGVGVLYAATSLNSSGAPLVHTFGMLVWAAYIPVPGIVFLCFLRGRLESRLERWTAVAFWPFLGGGLDADSAVVPAASDGGRLRRLRRAVPRECPSGRHRPRGLGSGAECGLQHCGARCTRRGALVSSR